MGEDDEEVDTVLILKELLQFIRNVKAIPDEFQHALVVADIDGKKMKNVLRKTCTEISFLKDVKIRMRFNKNVIKLDDVVTPHLWGHFKNGVLKAFSEVCGKKMGRRNKEEKMQSTKRRNEAVKDAVSRKKGANKAMCRNSTNENNEV